ncbi:PREDICTED: uncharacterized protein LOC108361478 [Rhagoletis zephyria]|uniref:uncharacterized protein LOC108361478 n=1 Tax=Rhagoletis zephyria TaxID=28612 RepID=UPI0008118FA2|nr:PREDICTED: uncharacterized protein LOC108361478 [Rhagoletis zephyria]
MSPAPPSALKRRLSKGSPSPKTLKLDESVAALPSILTAIRELEEKIQCQTEKLQRCETEVEKLRLMVEKVEAEKIAPEVAADAVVLDIPFIEGGNLKSTSNLVCLSIDFHVPQIRDIFRIKRMNSNTSSVVIIKFYTPTDRNRTLRAFSNYRRRTKSAVSLSVVCIEGTLSIFESLAAATRKILQETIRLRRAGKLVSVFTLRGAVYARVNKGSPAIKIYKQNDLQKFC